MENQSESKARYQDILDNMSEGFQVIGYDWKYKYVNESVCGQGRQSKQNLLNRTMMDVYPEIEKTEMFGYLKICMEKRVPQKIENKFIYPDGSAGWFELSIQPSPEGVFILSTDITARKEMEEEQEVIIEFLSIINSCDNTKGLIHSVVTFIQKYSGCEAVGIRLRKDKKYPYYETRGFSEEHIRLDHSACAFGTNRNPTQECLCGRVIKGRFNAEDQHFTEKGSFWGNRITDMFSGDDDNESLPPLCGSCRREGYESIALIPLHSGDHKLGLLQLNDKRENRFSERWISIWETIADYLAVALSKFIAEEEKQESDKIFRLLIEHAPAALAMFDREMKYLAVSKRWLTDYNIASESILGKSHYEIFPEINEDLKKIHSRGMKGEIFSSKKGEKFVRGDGSEQWLNWEIRPWYNTENEVGGIVIFSEDITSMKAAEMSLRESRAQLSSLMSNLPGMAYQCLNLPEWPMSFVSQGCKKLTGYNKNELLKNEEFSFVDLIHPDDKEIVWAEIQKAVERNSSFIVEYRIFDKKGDIKWVWEQGREVDRNNNGVSVLDGFIADITDRKNTEARLEEQEKLYQTLFNNSPVPLWEEDITDLYEYLTELKRKDIANFRDFLDKNPELLSECFQKTKILNVNYAALRLHEVEDKEVLIKNQSKILTPNSFIAFKEILIALAEGETEFSSDAEVQTFSGKPRFIFLNFNIMKDNKGAIKAILSTTDITEKKKTEIELLKNRRFLADLIENSGALIYAKDKEGCYELVNAQWEQVTHITKNEAIGKTDLELFPGADGNQFFNNDREVLTKARLIEKEETLNDHNRTQYFISIKFPLYDELGKIRGICGMSTDITDRKIIEENLRVSEYRLRSAFDNMMEGVQILDNNWRYLYLNHSAEIHNRRPKEELLENKYMDMWPGIEDTYVFIMIKESLEKRVSHHFDNEFTFPNGAIGWFKLSIQPVPEGVLILSVDITDKKKSELQLKKIAERLEIATKAAKMGVWDWDVVNNIIVWDDKTFELYGIKKEDFENTFESWIKGLHPEDRGKVELVVKQALNKGREYNIEFRVVTPDKQIKHLKSFAQVIRNEKDEPVRMIGINYDITELKNKETEILLLNERLNELINYLQQLSSTYKIEDLQSLVSSAARKISGADGATFVLKDNDKCYYVDEDSISPLWKGNKFPLTACISGWVMLNKKEAVIYDIYKDSRVPVAAYKPTFVKSLAMVPVKTDDPVAAIGVYWSFNYEPSKIEMQLISSLADAAAIAIENIKLYEELEMRVNKRTEQLEIANKELESFSYSVSHDLRAPLRAIDGFAGILKEEYSKILDKEGNRLLNIVISNARDMAHLIDDLLSFSRVGRKEIMRTGINMKELAQFVIDEYKEADKKSKVKFIVSDLPGASGDTSLVKQVWRNLIGNAVKFSSKNEKPVVEIGSIEENNNVIYYVRDNGVGFENIYIDKIFGVFQRLHSKEEFEGTGVGLAIVQRIITKHGGSIRAEGKLNKGATFYFTLE